MVRWVVGSILDWVDSLSYISFKPVLHDWCNKGRCMCYPVCGMVHIKEPLLLIGKSSPCGGSGFPLSLSEWSFTICPMPYNRERGLLDGWMDGWMDGWTDGWMDGRMNGRIDEDIDEQMNNLVNSRL